jgi:nuclease S1
MPRPTSWVFTAPLMLALLSCGESTVFAWGNEGHQLVCEIALQRLTLAGRTFLDAVRALEADIQDPFEDCQSCSAWPSERRAPAVFPGRVHLAGRVAAGHVQGRTSITSSTRLKRLPASICSATAGCSIARSSRFSGSRNTWQRSRATAAGSANGGHWRSASSVTSSATFISRCMSHIEDLGGNLITVKFTENGQTRTDKLHAVWDSAVLRRAGLTIADAHALNTEITATEATQWATFTIADWATESEALAREHAYTKPDGTQVQDNDLLDDAYFAPAIGAVKLQIKRGGVRLAMLIDAAAAGTLPANLLKLTP